MFSMPPAYNNPSLGEQITDRLRKMHQNELLNEQIKGAKQENQFNPQLNQLKMQAMQQQAERQNQLFPEELKKNQLSNQLSQMQIEDYAPRTQTERAYKNALTQKMEFQRQNPLYGQAGAAGQIGAAQLSDPETAKMIMNALASSQSSRQSQTDLNNKRAEGYSFNSLPTNERSYLIAQAAGMGVEPNEAINMFNKGKTVDQMAIEQGYDPNNKPEPVYPLTSSGQTQLKMRQAANAEIKVLGDKISKAMSPYSRKILGYSPVQIVEAMKGENKDSQAKLLAARALQPELASIRLRMGGGNVGIEAIREMTNSSMGHIGSFESLVSPEVYEKTNEYVDKWLTEAVEAANKKSTEGVRSKGTGGNLITKAAAVTPEAGKNIMTYNPKTGRLE